MTTFGSWHDVSYKEVPKGTGTFPVECVETVVVVDPEKLLIDLSGKANWWLFVLWGFDTVDLEMSI